MRLLSKSPAHLVEQIDTILHKYDGPQLVEELVDFTETFPPSAESFPTETPQASAFQKERKAQFSGPSVVHAWVLAVLQHLLTRQDMTGISLKEEVPAERYISLVQGLTHEQLLTLVSEEDLVRDLSYYTPDISPHVKQHMVYFLYWLNEADFFEERYSDDDAVEFLERPGVNMTDVLGEQPGDDWLEPPQWQ